MNIRKGMLITAAILFAALLVTVGMPGDAMAQCFIGEIRMFGGNFAPQSWALCDGQLLSINSNTALFSILGTTYGGDGETTFGLPDLRGRAPIHAGNGPGLSDRRLGARGGTETNTLNVTQLPSHNHSITLNGNSSKGNAASPSGAYPAGGRNFYSDSQNANMNAGAATVGNAGGSQSVNNMPPWQAVNYIICLQGTFPSE